MIRHPLARLAAVAVLLGAATACDEASAPQGRSGTLSVRAYIDRDASGTFTTADSALAGIVVTATPLTTTDGSSAGARTATTGAAGLATFASVAPGSYRLSIGAAPGGMVLVSNTQPTATVDFRGTARDAEFRFSFLPGDVSGRIFRDDNANGTYDQGTDAPGAGLVVYLRRDVNGVAADTLRSVTTDATGAYRFFPLAPGSYFIEFQNPTSISFGAAGAVRRVTVGGGEQQSVSPVFTGSLISTIAEARAKAVGTAVAVRGVLTVRPGQFAGSGATTSANSELFVQDATGGMSIFSVPTADSATLAIGDSVEVRGTISVFSGQVQIAGSPTVTRLGTGTPKSPLGQTAAQARALTADGRLVSVANLVVDSILPGATAFTVRTIQQNTNDTLNLRVGGSSTGLTRASFTKGQRYNITGILSQNGGFAQVRLRSPSDVVLIPATATPARIVINELMPDPNVVADNFGEYFELYNAGGTAQELQGWGFLDGSTSTSATRIVIDRSLIIAPGQYLLFAVNGDPATNGGLPTVDFVYSGTALALNNSAGTNTCKTAAQFDCLRLFNAVGDTVDYVEYSARTSGAAFGLVDPAADNQNINGPNWLLQTTVYGVVANGNKGTPRARNDGAAATVPALRSPRAPTTAAPAGAPAAAPARPEDGR